jgi:hypothetical protein
VVEKDYAAIAHKMIIRPADQETRPRILVYSPNKKGKTTFGVSAGVDKTLVIDPEQGTKEMRVKNPHVWPVTRWEEMDDVANYLRFVNECPKCPSKHPFEWVNVDGLTKISNMSLKYVMKVQEERSLDRQPGMVVQRDYGKAGELMKDMVNRFHAMPLGVIFTAQERQVEGFDGDEDEEVDSAVAAYVPDLPKGVRGTVNSIVDVIGRLYVVKTAEGKAERRLWVGESVRYDTGYRSDYVLPDMVRNPTIPKLVRLMRTGKATVAAKKAATSRATG